MEKQEELQNWKERLRELTPAILEQIEWLEAGNVQAFVNPECPEKLLAVAKRLVELQNSVGEYKRERISKEDIERIKYFSKTLKIAFEDVVKLAVSNSRYLSKTAIEARGVAGYILEIQSVYDNIYKTHRVFPINVMDTEVKRACRNFKTDVSIKDKIEAIVEVFMPELGGMKIVETDYSIKPQTKYELSEEEITALVSYFKSMAQDGKIDACFEIDNQDNFLKACKLLSKANLSVSEFLEKWTNLTYSKCYSVDIIPAIKQMIKSYRARFGTTRRITDYDPYLRGKIETAERAVGKYTIKELLDYLKINNDNLGEGRSSLSYDELVDREKDFARIIKKLYPKGLIERDFIKTHPAMYEELKLLSNRLGTGNIDDYLKKFEVTRESSHKQMSETSFYLSEGDMIHYNFFEMVPSDFDECNISELNPKDYLGVYERLVSLGLDWRNAVEKRNKNLGE